MRSFVHSSSSASLMSSSVNELPVYHGEGDSPKKRSASEKRYKYLRRIFMFRQMDFEFAVWQVTFLYRDVEFWCDVRVYESSETTIASFFYLEKDKVVFTFPLAVLHQLVLTCFNMFSDVWSFLSQLIHLCIAPQKVYLNFQHRKRTKDQWARDDPSFLILLGIFLVVRIYNIFVIRLPLLVNRGR